MGLWVAAEAHHLKVAILQQLRQQIPKQRPSFSSSIQGIGTNHHGEPMRIQADRFSECCRLVAGSEHLSVHSQGQLHHLLGAEPFLKLSSAPAAVGGQLDPRMLEDLTALQIVLTDSAVRSCGVLVVEFGTGVVVAPAQELCAVVVLGIGAATPEQIQVMGKPHQWGVCIQQGFEKAQADVAGVEIAENHQIPVAGFLLLIEDPLGGVLGTGAICGKVAMGHHRVANGVRLPSPESQRL